MHTRESHAPDFHDCPPAKRLRSDPQNPPTLPKLRIGDVGLMGHLLVRGESGTAVIDAVAPMGDEWVIDKPGKGMFFNTRPHERLQAAGISHLMFTGVTTEVCVQSSMREANERGYECLVVEDATESYSPEFKTATLAMLTAQGAIVG